MNEERDVLRDVIGAAQPKEESKAKKYIRIAFICAALALLVLVFVMAALRKYGG